MKSKTIIVQLHTDQDEDKNCWPINFLNICCKEQSWSKMQSHSGSSRIIRSGLGYADQVDNLGFDRNSELARAHFKRTLILKATKHTAFVGAKYLVLFPS